MSEQKRLKLACDDVFSLVIRQRDGWTCQFTGWPSQGYGDTSADRVDCAHIIGRGAHEIRHDEANAVALSRRKHCYFSLSNAREREWHQWCREKFGDAHVDELERRKHIGRKRDYRLTLLGLVARARELGCSDELIANVVVKAMGKRAGLDECARLGLTGAA